MLGRSSGPIRIDWPSKRERDALMADDKERYQKQKPRRSAPAKTVRLSEDAKRAYEELIQKRDEREREYARHLSQDNKPR